MDSAKHWLGYILSMAVLTAFGMAMFSFAGVVRPGNSNFWLAWVAGVSAVGAAVGQYFLAPAFKTSIGRRPWVLIVLLCGAPTGVVLGFWGRHVKEIMEVQDIAGAHLDLHLADYLNEHGDQRPVAGDFVCGKCVMVDMEAGGISALQFELPDSLKPRDAAEVGTAVQVAWVKNQVATYENGAAAYRWEARVRAYDIHQHVVIAQYDVLGTEPPKTTDNTRSDSGTKPLQEVVDRLEALPVKPLN